MSGSQEVTYQVRYRKQGDTTWTDYGPPINVSAASIHGLDPNTPYEVEVLATNTNGTVASMVIPAQTSNIPLTAPTQLIATGVTNTSLTLSWQPSSQGTPPILYQALMRPHGSGPFTAIGNAAAALSVSVFGLSPNTMYDFEVVASNVDSTATSSQIVASTSGGVAPSPPAAPIATNVSSSGVTLSWGPSATGTVPIQYQVFYRVTGSTAYSAYGVPGTALSLPIGGLQSATSYDLYVQASNAYGTANSATTTITTGAAAGPPTAPALINATSVADTSLTLNWEAASGGTPPLAYTPQYRIHNTGNYNNLSSPLTALSLAVNSLTAATAYDFRIVVTDALGAAATSGVQTISTLPTMVGKAPSAPTLSLVSAGPREVTLKWSAPATGTPPLRYLVRYKQSSAAAWIPASDLPIAQQQVTVDGLVANTSYNFEVTAYNAVGASVSPALVVTTAAS